MIFTPLQEHDKYTYIYQADEVDYFSNQMVTWRNNIYFLQLYRLLAMSSLCVRIAKP